MKLKTKKILTGIFMGFFLFAHGTFSLSYAEQIISSDPYETDEAMRMASEKVFIAEESQGMGSGMPIMEKENISYPFVLLIGIIGGLGIILYFKIRK